ncbi:hypothetical protein OHB35_53070 [Streptomyces phaeochromogenes]|uniref:Uncharacterized protein n=1 Tax=Streptomyces phaeochromogenes TaxID=1923 RepID=A0ABZ1HUE7_STRPH|nr:hypothetical protein [Streptomyces phaeochromogenes]WSD21273.1 hypothetical protein OHB35_53070 [Streptomyces phaeochromogenes]
MPRLTDADLRPGAARTQADSEPDRPAVACLAFAEEIGQGIAETARGLVWLPSSLHASATTALGEALGAALGALSLPQLPAAAGTMPDTLDSGGVLDAVAGLLPSAEAARGAGRRIGALVHSLLSAAPAAMAVAAAGKPGAGGGGPIGNGGSGQDPDQPGPYTLLQAAEAVVKQQEQLARLFGFAALPVDAAGQIPGWAKAFVAARALESGAMAATEAGLIVPSSAAIGNDVHRFLEVVYRLRRAVPDETALVGNEICQERRVYWFDRPSMMLSDLSALSKRWELTAAKQSVSWPPDRPLRYDALWVGLWSRATGSGALRPDTLDFTRGLLWEIKPATRASQAVAQVLQYVNGYNLAYTALSVTRKAGLLDPHEPLAIAPGGEYAWPSGIPIPVLGKPDVLAVPFTMDALPGLVSYVVVGAETLGAGAAAVYVGLEEAVKSALAALRRLLEAGGDLRDKAGRHIGEWVDEFIQDIKDFRPAPGKGLGAPERMMTMLWRVVVYVVLFAFVAAVLQAGGTPAALAVILLLIVLFTPRRQPRPAPGTVPVLTPEGGFDPNAALGPAGDGDLAQSPTVRLDTPFGPVPMPAGQVAPLLAALTAAGGSVTTVFRTALTDAVQRAYANYGPLGPPHPAGGPSA